MEKISGPNCSKLKTAVVNVSLKVQTLISQIRQYFLLKKKCEKLLQCNKKQEGQEALNRSPEYTGQKSNI